MNKQIILFFCLCFLSNRMAAQSNPPVYKFIKTDINRIENDSNNLIDFYSKLSVLKTSRQGVVRIVHIGDSHIQADGMSGALRQDLQVDFGNAGRGLVFPYRVAKTNGPDGLRSSSNVEWQAVRNVYNQNVIPVGICGITIETASPNAMISESVSNTSQLDYSFNHVSLFYEKGKSFFDFEVADPNGIAIFKRDTANNPNLLSFNSTLAVNSINICTVKSDSMDMKARLFGILLQNDSAGVLFNMIGVNGAEYRNYLASEYFTDQLGYLRADLIIISLGTNESINAKFNEDEFYYYIKQTIEAIRIKSPNACFLLTTPPDSYRWRKGKLYRVVNAEKAAAVIIKFCTENNIAYWNLNAVMGGPGSRLFWARAGLSSRDYIHFNPYGYQLQGNLLYEALMHNYKNFTVKGQ